MPGRFFSVYRTIYLRVGWLIEHAGPFGPALTRLAVYSHDRLIPRSIYARNPVQVNGLVVFHEGLPVAARSLGTGMYESDTFRLLRTLLSSGMTVLDVGANIGYFSLVAARLVGNEGAVWAFEPVPQNLELLQKNIIANRLADRIHLVPQAVSNAPGFVDLYINPLSMGLSSLYEEASTGGGQALPFEEEIVKVACTTLDEWGLAHQWPTVDLVKIDVEGSEREVLAGMVGLSRRNPNLKLIIEFNVRTLGATNTSTEGFFAAITTCGLSRVYAIGKKLRELDIPSDIPWLIRTIEKHSSESANLLCVASTQGLLPAEHS